MEYSALPDDPSTVKPGVFFRKIANGFEAFNTDNKPCDIDGKLDVEPAKPETPQDIEARLRAQLLEDPAFKMAVLEKLKAEKAEKDAVKP